MPQQQLIAIPQQVLVYLQLHHVITLGTSSFTGMPHAATTAYASNHAGVYFSMHGDERTLQNIDANHYASFTIDDYTPDFRKVRELRGVGRCDPVVDATERAVAKSLFAEKLPSHSDTDLVNLQRISPIEVHFVDFEYTAGVAVPRESSIVYEADSVAANAQPAAMSTQLTQLIYEAGQIIVRQGERSERLYIIVEGAVEVRREGHGQDVVVTRHGAGQLFGEISALTGAPQSATFAAATQTVVLAVDRSAFQDFVSQSAAADLGERVRATLSDLRRDT